MTSWDGSCRNDCRKSSKSKSTSWTDFLLYKQTWEISRTWDTFRPKQWFMDRRSSRRQTISIKKKINVFLEKKDDSESSQREVGKSRHRDYLSRSPVRKTISMTSYYSSETAILNQQIDFHYFYDHDTYVLVKSRRKTFPLPLFRVHDVIFVSPSSCPRSYATDILYLLDLLSIVRITYRTQLLHFKILSFDTPARSELLEDHRHTYREDEQIILSLSKNDDSYFR